MTSFGESMFQEIYSSLLGFCNQVPHIWLLKMQRCAVLQFWRLEVQSKVVAGLVPSEGCKKKICSLPQLLLACKPSLTLLRDGVLLESPHNFPSAHVFFSFL